MNTKITKLIGLVKKLPEDCVDDAIKYLEDKIDISNKNEDVPPCPNCGSTKARRFGHKGKRQRYRCNDCQKTFVKSTNTVMYNSRYGEAVWKQVIKDTLAGKPMDGTAASIEVSHSTAFRMRHKVLLALEANEKKNPVVMSGVCELDETYVLESSKGKEIPKEYWRKARRHGAKAVKSGISKEYISICTGIQRDGGAISQSVTRSTPGKKDLITVFGDRISSESIILYDGLKSYIALGKECKCPIKDVFDDKGVTEEEKKFYNINSVNSFHSFIKNRYNAYRGVATKYLNRYNALFSKVYGSDEEALANEVYNILMASKPENFHSVEDVKSFNLLDI